MLYYDVSSSKINASGRLNMKKSILRIELEYQDNDISNTNQKNAANDNDDNDDNLYDMAQGEKEFDKTDNISALFEMKT